MKLNQIAAVLAASTQVEALQNASDYTLIRELERRIKTMIENRGCLSDEFIAKLENLKKSAESVKVHL